ncbi:hypothetical protein CPT_Ponderosa_004 [Stenotrophomonas phage Ponderosa]|uniref:Uncharacterized protein n=1 Tax=Stenotrophomonas phage Ponderosa TaxID=2591103 RepID=A0A5B9NE71_9CAUD|nr:hypothetical protein CPT_Ponderosa_004 [Stenotrophomonas phage Ponderosa]
MEDTITLTKAEAAVLREALQFCAEFDGLGDDEQRIFDKLDALFS